jgi:hypothetical protein
MNTTQLTQEDNGFNYEELEDMVIDDLTGILCKFEQDEKVTVTDPSSRKYFNYIHERIRILEHEEEIEYLTLAKWEIEQANDNLQLLNSKLINKVKQLRRDFNTLKGSHEMQLQDAIIINNKGEIIYPANNNTFKEDMELSKKILNIISTKKNLIPDGY